MKLELELLQLGEFINNVHHARNNLCLLMEKNALTVTIRGLDREAFIENFK